MRNIPLAALAAALLAVCLPRPAAAVDPPAGCVALDPATFDDADADGWVIELTPDGPFAAIAAELGTTLYLDPRGHLSGGRPWSRPDAPRPLARVADATLVAPFWTALGSDCPAMDRADARRCPAPGEEVEGLPPQVEQTSDPHTGALTFTWRALPTSDCAPATASVTISPRADGDGLAIAFAYAALPEAPDLADQPRAGVVGRGAVVELYPDAEQGYDRAKLLTSRGSDGTPGEWLFELDAGGGLFGDDGDGIRVGDNCLNAENPLQTNTDGDRWGDVCDEDDDNDDILDENDNCDLVRNPPQIDSDRDGEGDACDPDDDNDGLLDGDDLCPFVPDPARLDLDGDGLGDACDPDIDGDERLIGRVNDPFAPRPRDLCPYTAEAVWRDRDHDGLGDGCDKRPAVWCKGVVCMLQLDSDGDGIIDVLDRCPTTPDNQRDGDGDGVGTACDPDDDDDGVLDYYQRFQPMAPSFGLGPLPRID